MNKIKQQINKLKNITRYSLSIDFLYFYYYYNIIICSMLVNYRNCFKINKNVYIKFNFKLKK